MFARDLVVTQMTMLRVSDNLDASRYEWATAVVREVIRLAPSKTVLDIGAGSGKMIPLLSELGAEVIAFDVTPESPEITQWDLNAPPSGQWKQGGIAILLDVIEHCSNPARAIEHISGNLLPGGVLILTTPNPRWSRSRLHALISGVPTCFTETDLNVNYHVFTPWPHILRRLLSDRGFDVERYVTLDGRTHLPNTLSIRYPMTLLMAFACKLIEAHDRTACGMSYGMVAIKRRNSHAPEPVL